MAYPKIVYSIKDFAGNDVYLGDTVVCSAEGEIPVNIIIGTVIRLSPAKLTIEVKNKRITSRLGKRCLKVNKNGKFE